jgi:hypothetical protein
LSGCFGFYNTEQQGVTARPLGWLMEILAVLYYRSQNNQTTQYCLNRYVSNFGVCGGNTDLGNIELSGCFGFYNTEQQVFPSTSQVAEPKTTRQLNIA